MKNTTKLILALVVINLFAISFYLVKNAMQHQQEGRAEQESAVKAGQAWEKIGLMSQKDHARLYKLRYSVKKQGLSEEDFAWVKNISENVLKSSNPHADLVRHDMASLIWKAKNPTPAQREWAFHYAVALLETKDAAPNYLDKSSAIALVYVLKEKKAVPYLLPLLQHPDADIRRRAQGTLASLGYKQTAEKLN